MRTIFALVAALSCISCVRQESIVRVSSWEPSQLSGGPVYMALPSKPVKLQYSVDLAKPGALDRLEKENPDHYAKVLTVQRAASAPSCVDELRVLKADLKLDDAACAAMTTLASYPPKRNVSVMIDGVLYMTFVPIEFEPAKSVPLLHAPQGTTPR